MIKKLGFVPMDPVLGAWLVEMPAKHPPESDNAAELCAGVQDLLRGEQHCSPLRRREITHPGRTRLHLLDGDASRFHPLARSGHRFHETLLSYRPSASTVFNTAGGGLFLHIT